MDKEIENLRESFFQEINGITEEKDLNNFWLKIFGKKGELNILLQKIMSFDREKRAKIGFLINTLKKELASEFSRKKNELNFRKMEEKIDVTIPGTRPEAGHLHIISQAIDEISLIFYKLGFSLVRYREVEWDWYAFTSLNFPENHPARDDFETFFIDAPSDKKYGKMLLSPHTSSGQVREMERSKGKPPIRIINIAKCYRPNWDISHTPMFHQFEGLVIDKNINITHLKGTMDFFAKSFFGPERLTRLRPFHFQFTEPSFEVDINCGICLGKGILTDGSECKYCKEGWLELGGSGMVHPNVLRFGNIDPGVYTGFAFGWGVERTYMMKSGTQLDDNRLLYSNDLRFLKQF